MEWTTAIGLAARIGNAAYGGRHIVQEYFKKLQAHLDVGRTQVVVTGPAGVGKTMLRDQMHGRAQSLTYVKPKMSVKPEVDAIKFGEWTKLLRVLPGQAGLKSQGEIESLQDNPNLEGIIHVVDFGYSKPRDTYFSEAYIHEDNLKTIEDLRNANFETELSDLKTTLTDIRRHFTQHQCPKWLIIAVSKVDLFPNCKLPQDQVRGIVETHNTPELWDNEKEQMDGSADRSDAARA